MTNTPDKPDPRAAAGGQADVDEDELLIDGQEEVFSRAEVELGRIEHGVGAPEDGLGDLSPGERG
ncbi:MAG TPA: hypothetical protein VGR32_03770 [Brevundimonas sp.]|uniref:hypothetical protein n=1 Tax=Brevundimonas sp. TaxID=1871086 RepID=UPI002DE595E7|nr:hypothetical protein [Brevundimonas sp.]